MSILIQYHLEIGSWHLHFACLWGWRDGITSPFPNCTSTSIDFPRLPKLSSVTRILFSIIPHHFYTGGTWISATMSDAILPPPRSSSGAPDGHRSDSSTFETDNDMALTTSSGSESKDDKSNKSENKADAKQKRKRTRYVLNTVDQFLTRLP